MGATKNRQDLETLSRITEQKFGDNMLADAVELTEGLCNVAYRLTLKDGKKVILKIAPQFLKNLMSNEINMMNAEVEAMELVTKHTDLPVAKVYSYDTSCLICSSPYFMMEMLEGSSYVSQKSTMSKEEIQAIDYEIGQSEKKISQIKGTKFGLLGDKEHQTEFLYDYFELMMKRLAGDADAKNVDWGVNKDEILTLLRSNRKSFDIVPKVPCLVHWDMWEGNIFIKDGHLNGIIDWERAIWAESFMDDRFRRHTRTEAFLQGFGQASFTKDENIRILWYDCFLYLTMMTEGAYREYEDDSQYRWVEPLFKASYEELKGIR